MTGKSRGPPLSGAGVVLTWSLADGGAYAVAIGRTDAKKKSRGHWTRGSWISSFALCRVCVCGTVFIMKQF